MCFLRSLFHWLYFGYALTDKICALLSHRTEISQSIQQNFLWQGPPDSWFTVFPSTAHWVFSYAAPIQNSPPRRNKMFEHLHNLWHYLTYVVSHCSSWKYHISFIVLFSSLYNPTMCWLSYQSIFICIHNMRSLQGILHVSSILLHCNGCRCVFAQLTLVFVTLLLTNPSSVHGPLIAFENTGSRILIEVLMPQIFTRGSISLFCSFVSPEKCLLFFWGFFCFF